MRHCACLTVLIGLWVAGCSGGNGTSDAGACGEAGCGKADAGNCSGEDKQFFAKQLGAACCAGLTRIAGTEAVDGGCSQVPPDLFVCTRCGNGLCGPGESRCNCPNDCP